MQSLQEKADIGGIVASQTSYRQPKEVLSKKKATREYRGEGRQQTRSVAKPTLEAGRVGRPITPFTLPRHSDGEPREAEEIVSGRGGGADQAQLN